MGNKELNLFTPNRNLRIQKSHKYNHGERLKILHFQKLLTNTLNL